MKTNDYVKYMTQEIIKYMNTPRDERKEHKQEKWRRNHHFLSVYSVFCLLASQ